MNRLLVCLIALLCYTTSISAQSKFKIDGKVFDSALDESVGQAGIRIMKANDSTYVSGTSTLDNGYFSVLVSPGKYIVNITYLGYKPYYKNVNVTSAPVNLGTIDLKSDDILLGEAVVTAKVAEMVVKGDTVEYNADSYKVQPSAAVEDLVKKMPGAEVDANGTITINGKEVKKILVDGKEFFSSDPTMASKNLPASMVDKLQVLDRKSDMSLMTGFDDGEEETVINLTVKKGMKQGLFGNVSAGAGNEDRYGASGIVNYMHENNQFTFVGGSNNTNNEGFSDSAGSSLRGSRSGSLNFGGNNGITKSTNGGFNFAIAPSEKAQFGGNIRYGNANNDVTTSQYKELYTEQKEGNQYQFNKLWGNSSSNNFSADFRLEWKPDDKTKIIFSPNIQIGNNKTNEQSDYLTRYAVDTLNYGSSSNHSDGTTRSTSGKLDISRELNKKGRVLSFSFSGGYNDLNSDEYTWSKTIYKENDSIGLIDRKSELKNNGYNWSAYASYVEPIGRNNFIQLSYSIKQSHSVSDRNAWNLDDLNEYTLVDTTATKKLENTFLNQKIGLNFKSVRAKYNYTVGFALQPSRSESWTTTASQESNVSNNVLNFAPVAQFNYMWSKRHNLRLDYDGSTGQPTTTQLSNVRDESNPLNIVYGNPDLKPSFTNRLRIRFQKFNPEQASALMFFGGLTFSSNDIVQKTINLADGTRETTYDNINGNYNANLRAIYSAPLRNKKFSVNSMSYARYGSSNGYINSVKNAANTLNLAESLGFRFRTDMLNNASNPNGSIEVGLRGNINYSNTTNSMNNQVDQRIMSYGGTFNVNANLPYGIYVDSDLNYSANNSSISTYKLNQWLWNATLAKDIALKTKTKNYGTGTIKLNFYDILQQRTNISQNATMNGYSETITSTIPAYFMVSFVYKFQIFKNGFKASDMNDMDNFGPRGAGGPPPGERSGRPPRGM